jgi:hypothetical protein
VKRLVSYSPSQRQNCAVSDISSPWSKVMRENIQYLEIEAEVRLDIFCRVPDELP